MCQTADTNTVNKVLFYKEYTIEHLKKWGLIEKGWKFALNRGKKMAGCCKYRNKEISISLHHIQNNDENEVKDTILHEIAHALTPGANHGRAWKIACIKVGANPKRCHDLELVQTSKYYATCGCEGKRWQYHRKIRRTLFCRNCKQSLKLFESATGREVTIKSKYKATCPNCQREFGTTVNKSGAYCRQCGPVLGKLKFVLNTD